MKADNVFRFVALRGPNPREGRARHSIRLEDDESFVDNILRRVTAGETLERARATVSSELMSSGRYIMRSSIGRLLMQEQVRAERLLEDARRDPNARNFRRALQELLEAVCGPDFDLEHFAENNTFREMRRDVWHSYYSNVVLSTRRPQDRLGLLFWIRLFDLIPSIWDEAGFEQRLRDLETARLVVPHELVAGQNKVGEEEIEPDQEAEQIVRQRRLKIEALGSELERLRGALADVRAVYRERLHAAEAQEPALTPLGRERPDDYEDGDRRAPWQLQEANLQPDTHEALRNLRLSVTHATAPEIIHTLQARVAQVHSQLHNAQRVDEIVFRRGTFIRVRRKRA
jgi:hypothetical protein